MGDYSLSERFSVESGLYFSQIGAQAKEEGTKVTVNLGYLQLPILATYKLPISNSVKWSIQAGPYFGVGLGGNIKGKNSGVTVKINSFGDGGDGDNVNGGYQRFDMGLAFGTGVTLSDRIYVGVKYDLGLSNIMANKLEGNAGDAKIRNSNFSINVGYNF